MVNLQGTRYGIDFLNNRLRVIGRSMSDDHVIVDSIFSTTVENFKADLFDKESIIYFSVTEKEAVIKRVKISTNGNLDIDKLALFEFSSSLPDTSDNYFMETYPLNNGSERLVIGYNRELVNRKISFFESTVVKPSGFKLRAWALALGYINYCLREEGDLVCLLDIADDNISFCFLMDSQPILPGAIAISNFHSQDDTRNDSLIVDLTATIQYQVATRFNYSYSDPLSLIVVSGESASRELVDQIEKEIGIKTILPTINTTLFSSDVTDEAGKYLISLGLSVDS